MRQKIATISLRVPDETKTALGKAAGDDFRTTSSLAEKIITTWLKERGYLDEG